MSYEPMHPTLAVTVSRAAYLTDGGRQTPTTPTVVMTGNPGAEDITEEVMRRRGYERSPAGSFAKLGMRFYWPYSPGDTIAHPGDIATFTYPVTGGSARSLQVESISGPFGVDDDHIEYVCLEPFEG